MSGFGERFQRMKTCEYWVIAYRKRSGEKSLLHHDGTAGFRLLSGRKYVTQADPFLYSHQGKTWLFYERQNLTDMKGTLWCRNLDDAPEKALPVLEEPFHLSYPQVFRYGRYTYLLPEPRNAGEGRLYRCIRFPGEWERVEQVLDLAAVDTTLFPAPPQTAQTAAGLRGYYAFTYTQGRLEIYFCRVEDERFHIVKREKIYASAPSKTLRPGGAVIEEDGACYRPVQDCTDYYGQALFLNAIDRLDRQGFAEHTYRTIKPQQLEIPGVHPVGIHTYNRNGTYEVIDILHREISLPTIAKKIEWKCRGNHG